MRATFLIVLFIILPFSAVAMQRADEQKHEIADRDGVGLYHTRLTVAQPSFHDLVESQWQAPVARATAAGCSKMCACLTHAKLHDVAFYRIAGPVLFDVPPFALGNVPVLVQQLVSGWARKFPMQIQTLLACVCTCVEDPGDRGSAEKTFASTVVVDSGHLAHAFPEAWEYIKKSGLVAPYLSLITVYPHFKGTHGLQSGAILHELWHLAQFTPGVDVYVTRDPIAYPKGLDQEADAQALLNLDCYACAEEYAASRPACSSEYLTRQEALVIVASLDSRMRCGYHKGGI